MYKIKKRKRTQFYINESVEGETIEQKVKRALSNGEGISDSSQMIYTERKNGVMAEYNIRTDRFEIAIDAMDKISRDNTAKRKGNIVKMEVENEKKNQEKTGE